MKILVANLGSTSLKWRLFDFSNGAERLLHKGGFERVTDYPKAIEDCLAQLKEAGAIASECELAAVGFKTVLAKGVSGCVHLDERVLQAMTDYIGLGPIGEIHPYLSRPSEGHSVIDAVRAARNWPEANAGKRWLAIGHSQGGHGSLSAHELAGDYAPELDLLGTVSLAPAALFDRGYGGIDTLVAHIVGILGFYGGLSEYPEIDPDDVAGAGTCAVTVTSANNQTVRNESRAPLMVLVLSSQ